MSYITETVDEFFAKLDKMQDDLAKFSQNLDNRSEKIPTLLQNFERAIFTSSNSTKKIAINAVEKAAQKSLEDLRAGIETWSEKIEADRKGKQFIKKNEKNYSGLDNQDVMNAVKADMKRELENEIARDKQELEEIDKMISQINKLVHFFI